MRGIGAIPSTSAVLLVAVEGDGESITVPYKDEWKLSGDDRSRWYAEVRARLIERIRTSKADFVCIEDLEPMALKNGKPTLAWFRTAELRGVLAEASHTATVPVELRTSGAVTRAMSPASPRGSGIKRRPAAEFLKDEAFWLKLLGDGFPKKYREGALLVLSKMRAE
jgi:hypothetical protein